MVTRAIFDAGRRECPPDSRPSTSLFLSCPYPHHPPLPSNYVFLVCAVCLRGVSLVALFGGGDRVHTRGGRRCAGPLRPPAPPLCVAPRPPSLLLFDHPTKPCITYPPKTDARERSCFSRQKRRERRKQTTKNATLARAHTLLGERRFLAHPPSLPTLCAPTAHAPAPHPHTSLCARATAAPRPHTTRALDTLAFRRRLPFFYFPTHNGGHQWAQASPRRR